MKKKQTRKIKKYKGGTIIGKGLTGAVYYPALECMNPSDGPKGDNYISKLTTTKSAEKEFDLTSKLRELEDSKDFAIFPEYICKYNDKQSLLFSKYGGYSLVHYFRYFEDLAYNKNANTSDFDEKYYENIIKALHTLKKKVKYMNDNDIYQGDISFDNILYNEDEIKVYLIDFERGGKKDDETVLVQDLIDDLKKIKNKMMNK